MLKKSSQVTETKLENTTRNVKYYLKTKKNCYGGMKNEENIQVEKKTLRMLDLNESQRGKHTRICFVRVHVNKIRDCIYLMERNANEEKKSKKNASHQLLVGKISSLLIIIFFYHNSLFSSHFFAEQNIFTTFVRFFFSSYFSLSGISRFYYQSYTFLRYIKWQKKIFFYHLFLLFFSYDGHVEEYFFLPFERKLCEEVQ